MRSQLHLFLALEALSSLALSEKVGYFESSACADPEGFTSCYKDAETEYTNCVNNNCVGGSQACYKSCGGIVTCMSKQCPSLGTNCINACECQRSAHQIDCASASCWNEVYSCEYQSIVADFFNLCTNPNYDAVPFWPAPDDAPAACSCNLGKIIKKEHFIALQMTECANNMTNLNQLATNKDISEYGTACMCCGMSAIVSTIYDTCPNTNPTLLGLQEWYDGILVPSDWSDCGPYLEAYDCAGDLGYGRADAGAVHKFYEPSSMPSNGTATLSNKGGVVSTPVSGNTFTWTFGQSSRAVAHPITVTSANAKVTGKANSGETTATITGTGTGTAAESAQPGMGASLAVPLWTIADTVGALALLAL
ncbi:uncharacterized protein N7506_005536 [Penicillium brevicompactum]|uniref:uncharacterized protein n=1 Tax=Penicillium brevicompactum TaxID=5074 RepID=UPI00254232A9|nr:uncharacterized protein N7506_005536 [Penicillium brevicompactum]KAJ5337514.1 hypothetical protein N7506_005536 [Penicillium brevicompactum]